MKDNLGSGNTIFVGSSTDMFANNVPASWIVDVLERCSEFNNEYLFQTKNPMRFNQWMFPLNTILGVTIETDKNYGLSKAPTPEQRYNAMMITSEAYDRMVSIEPIMNFDLEHFVIWMKALQPKFVSIGADSQGHNLPEPSSEKVKKLIDALSDFTEVKVKDNLKRIIT